MQILRTEMLLSNRFSIFLQQISDAEFPCEQGFYFGAGANSQGIHLPEKLPLLPDTKPIFCTAAAVSATSSVRTEDAGSSIRKRRALWDRAKAN